MKNSPSERATKALFDAGLIQNTKGPHDAYDQPKAVTDIIEQHTHAKELLTACRLESEINDYIETLDISDDTKHPLWPVVKAMRAAIAKAEGRA